MNRSIIDQITKAGINDKRLLSLIDASCEPDAVAAFFLLIASGMPQTLIDDETVEKICRIVDLFKKFKINPDEYTALCYEEVVLMRS